MKKITDWELWRKLHTEICECECAGDYVCCSCTLRNALEEIARLRAESTPAKVLILGQGAGDG